METLIYSYHFAVIAIILITFVATICSMAKIGPFINVPPATTKVLVASLIIELAGAFVGVYKALPQLKFDVSEKYRFEITYQNITTNWLEELSEEQMALISPFVRTGGVAAFYEFSDYVDKYREVKNFTSRLPDASIGNYANYMTDVQTEYIDIYKTIYGESPQKMATGRALMEKFARYEGSSNKTGTGYMWASNSGDKMEGIVVYTFPDGQKIPTVLEFDGQKIGQDAEVIFQLNFTQSESALAKSGHYFKRPGGSFSVQLDSEDGRYHDGTGTYIGKLSNVGEIRIQLWEL